MNRPHLCESILPFKPPFEELCRYLREQEAPFFRRLWGDKSEFPALIENLKTQATHGIRFTFPGEEHYPSSFVGMPGAPILISFRGHASWKSVRGIAVVGSRDISQLSNLWMEDSFADFLREHHPLIVSGGARGVDQLAHQLALRNQCPTVAIIPSGLGNIYPQALGLLQSKIIDGGGCLLSEYAYDQQMWKQHFHDRNRLIAGLGQMTLLVEARRRSGSLITAQRTLELGKTVLVVPGHPCEASHLGNLDLLSDGATPVRDAHDLSMHFTDDISMPRTAGSMASTMCLF